MKFGKKGNLSLRYIDPFETIGHVGVVAYELALLPQFASVLLTSIFMMMIAKHP